MIDLVLKDICVQLNIESRRKEQFLFKKNGKLCINVERREKELSDEEKVFVDLKRKPINLVHIESKGFSFFEIQKVLENIKLNLPEDYKSRFMYNANFINFHIS